MHRMGGTGETVKILEEKVIEEDDRTEMKGGRKRNGPVPGPKFKREIARRIK